MCKFVLFNFGLVAIRRLGRDLVKIGSTLFVGWVIVLSPKVLADEANSLPRCIDHAKVVGHLSPSRLGRSNSKARYWLLQKQFRRSKTDDREILQRLAYAETLAAECPDKAKEVAQGVIEALFNRVNQRHGQVRSVVFEANQFASSLHSYNESRLKDFLCPRDLKLWRDISETLNGVFSGAISPLYTAKTTNYYFFLHAPRMRPPSWTRDLKVVARVESSGRLCFEAYANASWK